MKNIFIIIVSALVMIKCSSTKKVNDNGLPACINNLIDSFKTEPKQNPPRSIIQYTLRGNTVYYITSPCCDQFNAVYDSVCTYLGSPDGGITGKGDGKIPEFTSEKTAERIIWRDTR